MMMVVLADVVSSDECSSQFNERWNSSVEGGQLIFSMCLACFPVNTHFVYFCIADGLPFSGNSPLDVLYMYTVSQKTSPTFFAVTRESIIGFSYCLAHVFPRK